MPNWCDNYFSVTHSDAAQLVRVQAAYARHSLFEEFMPIEPEEDTVSGHAAKWGTKWDVGGDADDCLIDGDQLTVRFDTAWTPPLGFYNRMTELGFDVVAYYYEPGMQFCGKWTSQDGDDDYGIEGDSAWVTANIPADIDEHMGISCFLLDWEEEEQEETK